MAELEEFVSAQEPVWDEVVAELRAGRKTTHWIWWVFPQLQHLGRSERARHFGLGGLGAASDYLAHPILGPRLEQAAELLLAHAGSSPDAILGNVDALKVRSSMTLFERVPGAPPTFGKVLETFYDGERCPHTQQIINQTG